MDARAFLCTDQLQPSAAGVGVEDLVTRLVHDHALHERMTTFDAATSTLIEDRVRLIAATLGDTPPAHPPMSKRARRAARGIHYGLRKWDWAKVREAAALTTISGTVDVVDPLHIHDVCAGKGVVSLYALFLRAQHSLISSATCWELDSSQSQGHDLVQQWLGIPERTIFQSSDIQASDLSREPDRITHVLGKHACGPLTDAVFANIASRPEALQPERTVVMTCCHALLTGEEPFWPNDLSMDERKEIARRADPRNEVHPYIRDVVGLVCRRVVDTLRAKHIGGHVGEALPFGRECNRNQVISVTKAGS